MNEKKTPFSVKQANGLFLSMILLYLGTIVLLSFLSSYGIIADKLFSLFFGEALIVIPALVLTFRNRSKWQNWIPFHKIRISTVLLLVVFSYLILPIAMLANAVSMLFVENEMTNALSTMMDIPSAILIFVMGFYGPLCEEIAFRGAVYTRYRAAGRILPAVLISSLLFGLMHLNGNQLGYAAILGFAFAMLIEATGSLWASLIVHMIINTNNLVMVLSSDSLFELLGTPDAMSEITYSQPELLMTIGILLPVAAFSTVLAVGVYLLIARNEGRFDHIKAIFQKKAVGQQDGIRYITWSLAVAVLICVFVIFVLPFLPFIKMS